MNAYNTQYWLWASLNKKFGQEVKLKRDSLHRMYEVNRHGFEITTNTLGLSVVVSWFKEFLEKSGFVPDPKNVGWYLKEKAGKTFFIALENKTSEKASVFLKVYQN